MGCATLGAGLGLLQPIIVDRTISRAAEHNPIALLLVALATAFLTQAVLQAYSTYKLDQAGESIVLRLRTVLIDRLLRLRISVFDQQRLGDLIARSTTDTTLLRDAIAYEIVGAVVNSLVVVGGIAMMVVLDPLLTAVVVLVIAVAMLVMGSVLGGIRRAVESAQEETGSLASGLERVLAGIRTVRVNNRERAESESLEATARRIYEKNMNAARLGSIVSPAIELAVQGSLVLVIIIGLYRVSTGHMSIGELVAFLLYVNYVAGPTAGLMDIGRAVQTGLAALRRVDGILALPVEEDRRQIEVSPDDSSGLIFHGVRFAYGDRRILDNVTFGVPRNSYTALVGPSGAGKSTVVNLVARFYEADSGSISFGGNDLVEDYSLADWRAKIGLVEQNSGLMYGTLLENLTYTVDTIDRARLMNVLETTGLQSLVERLELGLETPVGEHGSALSGGEQQRVAIARALMKRPEILLLDEPTAHLDAENEQLLARTLRRIASECTVLVVAHRSATIRNADQVVVLDHGRVIPAGDYTQVGHSVPDSDSGTGRSVNKAAPISPTVAAAVPSTRDN